MEGAGDSAARRELTIRAAVASFTFSLVLLGWTWGRDCFWPVVAVLAARVAANALLARLVVPRLRWRNPTAGFAVVNTPFTLLLAHVSGWPFPIWFYLSLHVFIFDAYARRYRPARLAVHVASIAAVALWDGVPVRVLGAFACFCAAVWIIVDARRASLHRALAGTRASHERLEEAHRHLALLHQKMVQQEKLSSLGLMAAGIAHEINNPMSYVTSHVHELAGVLRAPDVPERVRRCAAEVLPDALDGIARVNEIVGDLRRFARGDPGPSSDYDLNAQVRTALRIASAAVRGRQVRTALGELPLALGRPQQITQVLVNLLVNAGHATAPGGVVEVATRRDGEELVVVVRDDGCGMSAETVARLFEPFHTTKEPGEGTGLGLAVAYGIVTAHGGRIEVESAAGRGTAFTLRLPVVAPEPVMTPLPGKTPAASAAT